MSENDFKITMRNEFLSLLGKAYWLESQFENIMQWQAYMSIKNDSYRNVLFQLSHDSEKHKGVLLQLITHFEEGQQKPLKTIQGWQKKSLI